jgi:hypothetical protein
MFLNQLAWLCDHKNGGNSTSMIAVEAIPIGSKFWLAANFDPLQKGLSHLKLVLTKLANLDLSRPQMHRATLNEILHESLVFSAKKFENYRRLLLRDISFVKKSSFEQQHSPG